MEVESERDAKRPNSRGNSGPRGAHQKRASECERRRPSDPSGRKNKKFFQANHKKEARR